jgi:hypothetical protein
VSADIDALSSADDAARADFSEDPVDQPASSCSKTAAMTLTVEVEPPPELTLTVEVIPPAE